MTISEHSIIQILIVQLYEFISEIIRPRKKYPLRDALDCILFVRKTKNPPNLLYWLQKNDVNL